MKTPSRKLWTAALSVVAVSQLSLGNSLAQCCGRVSQNQPRIVGCGTAPCGAYARMDVIFAACNLNEINGGGPLVMADGKGGWMQAGVVSFGDGCVKVGVPGIYASTFKYAPGITATIGVTPSPVAEYF